MKWLKRLKQILLGQDLNGHTKHFHYGVAHGRLIQVTDNFEHDVSKEDLGHELVE